MASVNGRAVSVVPARAAGARPRRDYWRGVVEACRRSGMSQAAFCRRRGLSSGTLGYWKCILAREARPGRSPARLEPKPPAFLPVRIAGPPPRPAAMSGAPPASRGELEIAQRFIDFACQPEIQANVAKHIPYGASNRLAYKSIPADVAARLPSSPEHRAQAFLMSGKWWADNRGKVSERWSQWLLQKG